MHNNKRTSKTNTTVWSDLPRRLTTICLGVPILWIFWWTEERRWIFFQGVHLLMALEWAFMTRMSTSLKIVFPVLSLLLSNVPDAQTILFILPLFIAILCISHGTTITTKETSSSQSTSSLLDVLLGLSLIALPHRSWLYVSESFYQTVVLLLTVWNGDSGALLAGRCSSYLPFTITTPTWLHRISPSKSLVGLAGGILSASLTYMSMPFLWKHFIMHYNLCPLTKDDDEIKSHFSVGHLCMALALGLLAVLGDLWESSLKRRYNVKDSGPWLPGHGGILDRFDSSLLAVILYHWYLQSQSEQTKG